MNITVHDDAHEEHTPLRMRAERSGYGIQVDCFLPGEKFALTTVSIAYFDNQVCILFWDKETPEGDDPRSITLVENVQEALKR